MTSKMTDFDAYYGEHKPSTCEWSNGCNNHVLHGKSYCAEHYAKAFKNVSEQELERLVEENIKKIENGQLD